MNKEKTIPVSENGLEPHLVTCMFCGSETGELTIGVLHEAVVDLGDGKTSKTYFNRGDFREVKKNIELAGGRVFETRPVPHDQRYVPAGVCNQCAKEHQELDRKMKEMEPEVRAGGAYFRCKCGNQGAINKDGVARMVGEGLEKFNAKRVDGLIGVEIGECWACQPEKKEQPKGGQDG